MSSKDICIKGKKRMATDDTPVPSKRGHWVGGLLETMKDPDMIVYSDDQIVIIKDKYPKAHHHYLVLPKEHLASLKSIESRHMKLLHHMDAEARHMTDTQHPDQEFRYGYHAIPSMAQVHLHIISQDFDSPSLKTKRHWNSFTTPYFIDSKAMLESLESSSDGRMVTVSAAEGKRLLDLPLQCHRCSARPANMPKLKQHLLTHL